MTLLEFIENHYWSLWILAAFTVACLACTSKIRTHKMREYVVNEYIKCDLCGYGMASETNGTTVHHAYTSNATCFEGVVKVSAIICGR